MNDIVLAVLVLAALIAGGIYEIRLYRRSTRGKK